MNDPWPGPGGFRHPGPIRAVPGSDLPTATVSRPSEPSSPSDAPGPSDAASEDAVLEELRQALLAKFRMPIVAEKLRSGRGETPQEAAERTLGEVRSGCADPISKERFVGPRTFLRVVTRGRGVYGDWWFDRELLEGIEKAHARIFFDDQQRRKALRDLLREYLALSTHWNAIEEVWQLDLPAGESIAGFTSTVARQRLFGDIPLTAAGNRLLVGQARQIYFPTKNPLWVTQLRDLAPEAS